MRNRAGRLTRAARACRARSSSPARSPSATTSRMSPSGGPQLVEHVDDGDAVVAADVGPDARVPRGDAGHVPEAAGGQAQQRPVLLAALVGQPHQRGRRQVGHVRHDRHQLVVAVGRQGDDLGPQRADDLADLGERAGVGALGGGEHPGGALEQVGGGALDALLLGAGHRVAAHEAGVGHGVDDRRLDPAHVGDDARSSRRAPGGPRRPRRRTGVATNVTSAAGSSPTASSAPSARALSTHDGVGVAAGHVPAAAAQAQADRAADEAGADDDGPARLGGRPSPTPADHGPSGRSSRRLRAPSR